MKLLIFTLVFISSVLIPHETLAQNRNKPVVIITPNGPVRLKTPFDKPESDLKGVGNEFVARATVKDGKVSVWVRGCQNVEIGDINKEDQDKEETERLKKIKNNDNIKLKMTRYGACEVAGWKKN